MHQTKKTLTINLVILIILSLLWFFQKQTFFAYIQLYLGFLAGQFFLELDHILYWYQNPSKEESQIGRQLIEKAQFKRLLSFYLKTKDFHQSLFFHHIYTQISLLVIGVFLVTSADTYFARSLALFLNTSFLTKQLLDFKTSPMFLQSWLFARLDKQLPLHFLPHYLGVVGLFNLFFFVKMVSL